MVQLIRVLSAFKGLAFEVFCEIDGVPNLDTARLIYTGKDLHYLDCDLSDAFQTMSEGLYEGESYEILETFIHDISGDKDADKAFPKKLLFVEIYKLLSQARSQNLI